MSDILGKTSDSINIVAQIPVMISTLLFAIGWTLTLLVDQVSAIGDETPLYTALIFGFLGSYFFSLNTIFRRYVRADLNTKAYTHMASRVLITFLWVWVLNELLLLRGEEASENAQASVLYIVAFFVGIVPETASAVLQDFLRSQSWVGRFIPALQVQHPLHKLNGITLYDQARLLEEGIENIEALAHHDLVDLMLHTRIPASRLVDLVDQAILYLHVRGPVRDNIALSQSEVTEDGLLYRLNTLGIRTATDLWLMYWPLWYQSKMTMPNGSELNQMPSSKLLVGQLDEKHEERLRIILHALQDDEWMEHVRHWREMSRANQYTYRFCDFVERFMKSPRNRSSHNQPGADDTSPPTSTPSQP